MIILGIDPGANGGLALLNSDTLQLELHTVPKVKSKVDYREYSKLLIELVNRADKVVVEEVHSIYGMSAKSNFEFGFINGFLVGAVNSQNVSYNLIQPKQWQKKVWNTRDIVKKANNKTDTKATSLLASKRIFNNESFLATSRSKVPHDGLVDAALIAYSQI